ncbi:MAG: FHA domain-containing protein [Lentisphaerae bacterium]|nr:FHA domain-containing protein [Lentisphaerota bacterium]
MKITFSSGELAGKTSVFSESSITIGREPDNILCLETGGVSRYHAVINCVSGVWSISDLGSTNGVKINGIPVTAENLNENDCVTIGEHSFTVSELQSDAENGILLERFKTPLFSIKKDERKDGDAPTETAGKKRIFSNRLYYTIIACLAVMGITAAVKMFSSPDSSEKNSAASRADEQLETIVFERVKYFEANIFRFAMTLDGNKASFTIDDAATERHSKIITKNDPPGADLLKSQLLSSGLMDKKSDIQPGKRNSYTRLVLISNKRCVEYRIENDNLPPDIADASSAVDEFAESCGMITVSRTSEEVMQIAADNFEKAEELFANFQSAPENLRDAIAKYKVTVTYLSQYSPAPPMAARAMRQLIKAEEVRSKLLKELRLEETRYLDSNQLEALRDVYSKMLKYTDPGTKSYDRTKRKLFKLDSALSKMGNRR